MRIPVLLQCLSHKTGINLLPVAVPHPTGPQQWPPETDRRKKGRKKKRSDNQELKKVKL